MLVTCLCLWGFGITHKYWLCPWLAAVWSGLMLLLDSSSVSCSRWCLVSAQSFVHLSAQLGAHAYQIARMMEGTPYKVFGHNWAESIHLTEILLASFLRLCSNSHTFQPICDGTDSVHILTHTHQHTAGGDTGSTWAQHGQYWWKF